MQEIADDRNGMFQSEMMALLLQVVKSWQVIAVTVALVLYMFLVNYVARIYHRPRSVSHSKPRRLGASKAKALKNATPEVADSANSNEALGLEEG